MIAGTCNAGTFGYNARASYAESVDAPFQFLHWQTKRRPNFALTEQS